MKKPYTKPILTSVAFRSEKGYAMSSSIIDQFANPINDQIELMFLEETGDGSYAYRDLEVFEEHNDWQEDGDGFWF